VEDLLDGEGLLRRTPKMARLEAVLFVAEGAVSTRRLAQLATLAEASEARELIDPLNASYDQSGSAFRIERVATGYQMLTRPQFSTWLSKLHERQTELKLSPPAMETLTVVAYRQPLTRADVEAVRGVQCSEMLKQLMERGLVRIAGEDDSLGRPYLYETTRKFLELFGLRNLADLPMAERLRQAKPAEPAEPAEPEADSETEDQALIDDELVEEVDELEDEDWDEDDEDWEDEGDEEEDDDDDDDHDDEDFEDELEGSQDDDAQEAA
jgi:segregation and condensation protein B